MYLAMAVGHVSRDGPSAAGIGVPWLRHSNNTLRQFLTTIGFNESDIQAYGQVISPSALDSYGFPSISFGSTVVAKNFGSLPLYHLQLARK